MSDGAGGIFAVTDVLQEAGQLRSAVTVPLVGNLVADAPHHDTGIVAELVNQVHQVFFRPFVKYLMITVLQFGCSSEDKDLMDLLRTKAEELARQVNPGAANNSMHERSPERILADCIAGVVSEYFWKLYLNSEENVVSETEFDDASRQIDLKVISNNKKIEVRSSFPRNGIEFAICHPSYEFDVIGPYSNNYKPGEIQKDYYVRTLFHLYNPTDIISMISADSFKVYLTGGATWDMMIDTDYSKNKTLLPDFGLGVIQKASYRVVPFSKSKDTREIKRVIIEDQQVKN